eukprot:3941569-Rhodomonas_salina.3
MHVYKPSVCGGEGGRDRGRRNTDREGGRKATRSKLRRQIQRGVPGFCITALVAACAMSVLCIAAYA